MQEIADGNIVAQIWLSASWFYWRLLWSASQYPSSTVNKTPSLYFASAVSGGFLVNAYVAPIASEDTILIYLFRQLLRRLISPKVTPGQYDHGHDVFKAEMPTVISIILEWVASRPQARNHQYDDSTRYSPPLVRREIKAYPARSEHMTLKEIYGEGKCRPYKP